MIRFYWTPETAKWSERDMKKQKDLNLPILQTNQTRGFPFPTYHCHEDTSADHFSTLLNKSNE